jgi:serine/threonine protein kinase
MADFEPKQFGKYFLLDKLAVGGMAEIYKAKTFGVDGFEKVLCIKRILPHAAADRDFITMLIDEAKLSVLLSHANIVQVYDLGRVGDDYFIAMEFINGVNLRDIMYSCREAQRPIPPEIAVYIVSEVCKGLDYAHRKTGPNNETLNIVHRDVSPQNILISYEGEVKIVDFGIAKAAMNISHTMAGILKGKIAYMSPEQALGKTVDQRTDIFSTGILLYEALTGTKLFTGESQFEVLKKIRTSDISDDTLPDTIPDALKPILAKALCSNVDERYPNAGDLQIELTKYLYSTHVDFSPRKLASFINELFLEDLAVEKEEKAREVAYESQTSSMNVAEGAKQIDIVHRDITDTKGVTAPIKGPKEALVETAVLPTAPKRAKEEEVPTVSEALKKMKVGWKWMKRVAAVALIAVGLWAVWKYIPQARFWEKEKVPPVAKVTTANINSEPAGATIFLDGKATGLTTPAVVPMLEVGKSYRVRLQLAAHIPVDQVLTISSPQPITVTIPLAKESGVLNVASTPPGAKIFLNGEDTGKLSPSTLDKLPLNVDQRINVSKEGFEDAEQVIKLTSAEPKNITLAMREVLPNTGSINITSEPAGAAIEIDGKTLDRSTPAKVVNLELNKEHTVKLALKDFEPFTKTFTLKDATPIEMKGLLKPPKPPEPEKPPVVEKGSIRVTSTPSGATIYLNRRATKKRTPATLSGLEVGKRYRVGMAKSGYRDYSTNVTVASAKQYSVSTTLKKKPEVEPTPTPEKPKPVEKPKPEERPKELYGEVNLSSTPPRATVTIDGQTIPARTPVTIRRVRTDRSHTITVSLSGYKSWSRSFKMTSTSKSIHATLKPK